jgi:hypothetical protein
MCWHANRRYSLALQSITSNCNTGRSVNADANIVYVVYALIRPAYCGWYWYLTHCFFISLMLTRQESVFVLLQLQVTTRDAFGFYQYKKAGGQFFKYRKQL